MVKQHVFLVQHLRKWYKFKLWECFGGTVIHVGWFQNGFVHNIMHRRQLGTTCNKSDEVINLDLVTNTNNLFQICNFICKFYQFDEFWFVNFINLMNTGTMESGVLWHPNIFPDRKFDRLHMVIKYYWQYCSFVSQNTPDCISAHIHFKKCSRGAFPRTPLERLLVFA